MTAYHWGMLAATFPALMIGWQIRGWVEDSRTRKRRRGPAS